MKKGQMNWLGLLLIMINILVVLCVALLALCGSADAEIMGPVKLVQARGGLNVREAPDIQAKATYLLEDCTTVIVLETVKGWSRVASNAPPHRVIGWVCSDYLK